MCEPKYPGRVPARLSRLLLNACKRLIFLPVLFCLSWIMTASGADTTYQCIPSGFSLGIPPIRGPYEDIYHLDIQGPVSYGAMRERLVRQLQSSSLFSWVTVPDSSLQQESSDLSLLISIPSMRQTIEGPPSSYELTVVLVLVENLGGNTLFSKTYQTSYESQSSYSIAASERFNAAIQIAFANLIPKMVVDLNQVLNQTQDPAFLYLAEAKTVTHSHLEPLWILPSMIERESPGLANYRRYVDGHLHDRLTRKDCFEIQSVPESVLGCIPDTTAPNLNELTGVLRQCMSTRTPNHGMALLTFLSAEGQQIRVRSALVLLPGLEILFDQTLITASGWHLGNALERLAAGIAQASHSIPH